MIFKPWDNWDMDCVFVPFRGWIGKTKDLKCLWTGYGSWCQTHRFQCVKNCNAAGFFTLNRRIKNVPPPKDIQPTWHNRGKHWSQHGQASLWNFDNLQSPWLGELRLLQRKLLRNCPLGTRNMYWNLYPYGKMTWFHVENHTIWNVKSCKTMFFTWSFKCGF